MDDLISKKRQLNALKSSKNVQHVLQEASKILGNPILVHDMEYKVIALTENNVADDPIWNEYASTGTVSSDWLYFFKDECFLEAASNAQKIAFLLSDKLKYDRLFGKLFTKHNIQVGCACMVACYKPFAPEDAQLFEQACDVLNILLSNSRNYQQYGQEAMENLICMLIEDKMKDKLLNAAHVESLYIGLKNNLYLAVVDISGIDPALAKLGHFRNVFKRTCPIYKYTVYGNYIIILMGVDKESFDINSDFYGLMRHFLSKDIHVGISKGFDNLYELRKHYQQALSALQIGLGNKGEDRVYLYTNPAD